MIANRRRICLESDCEGAARTMHNAAVNKPSVIV
jgi:hypothetical protein